MKYSNKISIVLCLLCSVTLGLALGQTSNTSTKRKTCERIDTIIAETLKRGEIVTADGTKAIVRTYPPPSDIEEIKGYGDDAVAPLQEHFSSNNGLEYELAMRLMAALGGERIISPFQRVILHDPSPRKREYALRWISQGPWDHASAIIRQAAETDADKQVRRVAKELLGDH